MRVRGRLDLIGKSFDLTQGVIDFDGRRDIDPRLDLVLEREDNDLLARIEISGRASEPELSFSSIPGVPEDEVLPRVLFGSSRQGLTATQAVQLALGLSTLLDGGGGTLDSVRAAAGLDTLRIEEDTEGNAAIAAGREIADGVFVGAQQSVVDNETTVTVEIDLFGGFDAEAEIGQKTGSSVGLNWKYDF